jgi:hypothetical protein
MNLTKFVLAFAYAVGSVVAYGHAYVNIDRESHNSWVGKTQKRDTSDLFVVSVAAAAVWPAYLSVQFFEQQKGEQ